MLRAFSFSRLHFGGSMDRVIITAPAKINLHLEIGARRADGYHDVESVFQALRIADLVDIRLADRLSLVCSPEMGLIETENLGYRAAQALGHRLGRDPDVSISIRKVLPAGAGLGGGSADAAAVLVGMAILWGIDPADPLLVSVAAELGADVPFFLAGGAGLYTGRGDEFVRALPHLSMPVALVKPPEPVSTAQAYAAFDRLPSTPTPDISVLEEALASGDLAAVARATFNNMTQASIDVVPSVGEALALCQSKTGVLGSLVAGSGSAVCALCESDGAAERVAEAASQLGWWSAATRTSSHGVISIGRNPS